MSKSLLIDKEKSELMNELCITNKYELPELLKIVVNIGVGDSSQNAKLIDLALEELSFITGQKPVITRAKKSIAGFKIRQGMPIGVMVTLRGQKMNDFFVKLTGVVLPRLRDFRGLSEKAFDGKGNYNIGIKDQLVFPEINYDKVLRMRGLNITIVTTAKNDIQALLLLKKMGFVFRKTNQNVTFKKDISEERTNF